MTNGRVSGKRGPLGASKVFRVEDGVHYDHSGKYAAFGPFDFSH